ncbi:mavicyanin [Silene latifolia]|uniref:mavicyanin n=1 Tax=Silene latifolia TaxID=37657 RepID=UPI003D78875E
MSKLVQGQEMVVAAIALIMFFASPAYGAVYKVGDASGWTTIGNVDYKQWAATKTFHLGDVVVFQYNAQFHNVMQVRHAEYKECNASSPIATHTTGNDTITITKHGHYFFLCGVPGHCQTGQKVDIHVLNPVTSAIAPSPSSIASSPANAATTTISPGPSSSAPSLWNSSIGLVRVVASILTAFLTGFHVPLI